MKNRRERAKEVRRRKVAQLAAYCRQSTVKNCTIPQPDKDRLEEKKVKWGTITAVKGVAEWNIPKDGFKQPKRLHKKSKKHNYKSDYASFPDHTFHPQGQQWYMEQVVQHKLAKWEKKNPRPVKKDQNPPDMFEQEFMAPWNAARENALKHIRDLVVSMYDKLPLTGRFQKSDDEYYEKLVAEIKDKTNEGHDINHLDPKKSPLLKKAQKKTDRIKSKKPSLVRTCLADHKRQRGRLILPKAA